MSGKHPTNSFANLVAQTANKQAKDHLEPFIQATVIKNVAQAAGIVEGNLKRFLANALTRLAVLEKIAISKGLISEEEISEGILNQEDESWGYAKTSEAASEKSLVRLVVRKKGKDQTEFALPYNLLVPSVGQGASELSKEVETALVGLAVGDKKEIQDGDTTLEVTVTRVSKKKEEANVEQSQKN
jgi:hypothetical protein